MVSWLLLTVLGASFSVLFVSFIGHLWKASQNLFSGTLDEHMHLLLPALIRLFKVDASVDVRRAAIKTLTRLIPRVQVSLTIVFGVL